MHCTEVKKDCGIFVKDPSEIYNALTSALPELIQFSDDDACLLFAICCLMQLQPLQHITVLDPTVLTAS